MKILLILALSYVLFIHGLGATSLWDPDEPRQAITAREMIERNDYIHPYLNGKPYLEKPPIYPWMIIAASKVSGKIDEFSARIPAALSATCLVVITYYLGRILLDPFTGLLSALMLAMNFQFLNSARDSVMDMSFALFIGLTVFLSYLAITYKKPWYMILSFLPATLATLTKGPAGFAIPVGIIVIYLCIRKELKRFIMPLVVGCAVSAALASIWFLVAGDAYWKEFILRQNLVRYTSAFDHKESLFYYFPKIFKNFLPWSVLLPSALQAAVKKKFWLPLVWFTVTFLFFEFSASKRAVYLLPLYPACALLCGYYMREKWPAFQDHKTIHLPLRFCALLLVALPCVFTAVLFATSTPVLIAFRQHPATYGGAAALAGAGAMLFFALMKKKSTWSLISLFVYFSLAGFFYHVSYLAVLDKTTKSPRLITQEVQNIMPQGRVAMVGFNSPGVIFYLGKPVETFYWPKEIKQTKNDTMLIVKEEIKQTKNDTMLIVKDSTSINAKHEIEEGFVPVKNVRYERASFTLYTNKDGK